MSRSAPDSIKMGVRMAISSSRIAFILAAIVLCLTIAGLAAEYSTYYMDDFPLKAELTSQFFVNDENNVPAWYSSSALLLASILLGIIGYTKKTAGDQYAFHWKALAIIFLFLSVDEAASLHEALNDVLYGLFPTKGYFYFIWVIPAMAFVLVLLLVNLRFLAHLPAKTRYQFLIAGTIFIFGAIGLEMMAGPYENNYDSIGLVFLITVEEFFEMIGIVFFIYALCSYISSHIKTIQLNFSNE